MDKNKQRQQIKDELQKELEQLESGEAMTFSLEEADQILERTIQIQEGNPSKQQPGNVRRL